jgi:hypothetical protein
MVIPLLPGSGPFWILAPFQLNSVESSLMLRPTVSRPVCLGIKHPSGAYDQIFITVKQMRVCWCGALSLTRGQVLSFTIAAGPRQRSHSRNILLSQIRDFTFCRLLWLAGLRCRYSTLPPHGIELSLHFVPLTTPLHHCTKHRFQQYLYCCVLIRCCGDVFVCDRCLVTTLHATIHFHLALDTDGPLT